MTQKCPSAIVRLSTNVKARISIFKKLPLPQKVIIEENEDDDGDNRTAGIDGTYDNVENEKSETKKEEPNYSKFAAGAQNAGFLLESDEDDK